jgi:parallel beta-helix repeat protein
MLKFRSTTVVFVWRGIVIAALAVTAPAYASVRYVNAARPDDSGDGLSWATAERTLQAALQAAVTGDEIWVAAGAYKPDQGGGQTPGDRSSSFQLKNGVVIYGGFGGTETQLSQRNPSTNVTTLSGDLNGNDADVPCTQDAPDCDSFGRLCVGNACIIRGNNSENSFHLVTGSGTDDTTILDGFTITAGNTAVGDCGGGMYNDAGRPAISNCTFSRNFAHCGGGIYNANGSAPSVTNCTFSGNSAGIGGAMHNYMSAPTVANCTFSGNSASNDSGGMHNHASNPVVTNCTFSGNVSPSGAGGLGNYAGSNSTVSNCTFSGNIANSGGGIYNTVGSSPRVTNCTFTGNTGTAAGGGMGGDTGSSATVTNCVFSGNSAGDRGGGMDINLSSSPSVTNCTFSGNSAGARGGGLSIINGSGPTITNCAFTGNSAANGGGMSIINGSAPTVNNSTFSGNLANDFGGGMYNSDSASTVCNAILWNNVDSGGMDESAQVHILSGSLAIQYSCVEGWTGSLGGLGNIGDDPRSHPRSAPGVRITGH